MTSQQSPHGSDTEPTTAYPFGFGEPIATPSEPPRRSRRTAGLLTGALLLGGAGGVAGAAGFEALDADPVTTATGAAASDDAPDAGARASAVDSTDGGAAEQVAAHVLPSVVKITVAGATGQGSGSGIILSSAGEILTNFHVVEVLEAGGRMTVNFNDGTSAEASVVGTDSMTDLAVIQAEDVSGLTPATIGDSDALGVGEGVVAIGSPFGLQATVTSGIVSALNRPVSVDGSTDATDTTYPAIQTDAAINPGNSGGALVNLAGEVVGINSSIRTSGAGESGSIGVGFAIPITKVLPIVDQLRNSEVPTHAKLGVEVTSTAVQDGLVTGAGIRSVLPGSAGAKAGLEPGDVVTRVDGQPVISSDALVAIVRGYRPGDTVILTVLRDGGTQELDTTLDSDEE